MTDVVVKFMANYWTVGLSYCRFKNSRDKIKAVKFIFMTKRSLVVLLALLINRYTDYVKLCRNYWVLK